MREYITFKGGSCISKGRDIERDIANPQDLESQRIYFFHQAKVISLLDTKMVQEAFLLSDQQLIIRIKG